MKKNLFILLLAPLLALFSCKIEKGHNPPVAEKIIFDTDMGSDCDDTGALALLHQLAD